MTIARAAAELYRMVSGRLLDDTETSALDDLMTEVPDGTWKHPTCDVFAADSVLDARVLAGVFLLHENVIWSAATRLEARVAFDRITRLVEGAQALSLQVKRVYRANGEERIACHDGRRLTFHTRVGSGLRGFSADCHVMAGASFADRARSAEYAPLPAASRRPQLVIAAGPAKI